MKAKNILLIDDNEIDNYITRHILISKNLAENIIVESSAVEALKFLHSIQNEPEKIPEYIFLDIRMPEMDGFGFLDEYGLFPEIIKNKCIICMLTSSNDEKDIERAGKYPYVKRFFKKPLDENVIDDLWS
jgi:CheY-like chemotaxis protein